MRRVVMWLPVIAVAVACSKAEAPPADTAAPAMSAEAPPPAPVALTEAAVAGTWKGNSMLAGTDSIIGKWTQVCANGSCVGTREGSTITLNSTYTLAGDSVVGVSKPYAEPDLKGVRVIDTWVVRIKGDSASGTGAAKLASKPDSVMMRYHFVGARTR